VSKSLGITLGAVARYSTTDPDEVNLVTLTRPYGSGDFGTVGAWTALRWDSRDHLVSPRRGARFALGGAYYPKVWDVESAYGEVGGEAAAYLGARSELLKPTLAFRVGGKRLFGTYPFQDAAFIGGNASVRGFRQNRFAGDASLYGSAELRLSLAKFFWVVPQEWGIFGLADTGRVWVEGESSRGWHRAFGGGVWMSFLTPDYTLSLSIARSEDGRIGVNFGFGFAY
jgi:hemolysin activation/secretion protein